MNDEIIKKLRVKIQKQEIDMKFLNEKLKKYENNEIFIENKQNIDDDNYNSKLNEKEVNYSILILFKIYFKVENVCDLLFHFYNQAKIIENFTKEA